MSRNKKIIATKAITKLQSIVLIAVIAIAAVAGIAYYVFFAPTTTIPSEILIGAHWPLTGGLGRDGTEHKSGGDMAVWYINEVLGGIYVKQYDKKLPIKYIVYDDTSVASNAVSAVERLVTVDGVVALCGGYGSGIGFLSSTKAEEYKIPYLMVGMSTKSIFTRGYKYIFGEIGVASEFSDNDIAYWANYSAGHPETPLKTIYFVYDTTLYNTERATADAAYAIQLGFSVVGTDSYTSPATDFTPILTKVKARNPDILCQLGYLADNQVFVSQVKENDINPKVLFVSVGAQLPTFVEGLGADAEQIWGQSCYERSWGQYANSDYTGLWQAADHFGYEANSFTASTFEAFMTLKDAIERAGSLDSLQIRDALAATNMTGVMGPLSFDSVYQWRIPSPWSAFQIQNGTRVAIWPRVRANGNATIPMIPWNERA